jgi:hypothetical protein
MTRIFLFLLVISVALSETVEAQSFYNIRRNRNLMVNFGSGTATYKGDLNNPGDFGYIKSNITVGAEYYLKPRISTRAQLTWFQLKGNDKVATDDRDERKLNFISNSIELDFLGVFGASPQGLRYYERKGINFHGFAGIGVMYFNPTTRYEGEKVALRPLKTEGVAYSRIQPVIPVGLGARIRVNPFFNVLIEGGYRFTFTDYLDDVSSTRYPTLEALGLSPGDYQNLRFKLSDRRLGDTPGGFNTETGEPLNEVKRTTVGRRGNPEENDGYLILNISVQYYLPKEIFRDSQRKLYTVKRKQYYRRPGRRK